MVVTGHVANGKIVLDEESPLRDADTYYFTAVANDRDQGHTKAVQVSVSYTGQIVTTEWVLTEVADALYSPAQRSHFLNLLGLISSDQNWIVIESSHNLFQRGVAMCSQRLDKS